MAKYRKKPVVIEARAVMESIDLEKSFTEKEE